MDAGNKLEETSGVVQEESVPWPEGLGIGIWYGEEGWTEEYEEIDCKESRLDRLRKEGKGKNRFAPVGLGRLCMCLCVCAGDGMWTHC